MLMRKIDRSVKHENFPSSSNSLLASLDLMSPIGKIRQREPGPVTSTPLINTIIRSNHIRQSNYFDKLSHIYEVYFFLVKLKFLPGYTHFYYNTKAKQRRNKAFF